MSAPRQCFKSLEGSCIKNRTMKKPIFFTAFLGLALAASAEQFKVIAPLPADAEGSVARLVNFYSGDTGVSVRVKDKCARFEGIVDEGILARIMANGSRTPVFILEPGTISFNEKEGAAFGTMLNDQFRQLNKDINAVMQSAREAGTDEAARQAYDKYEAMLDSTINSNTDNVLGYYLFLSGTSQQMDASSLREAFKTYPAFAHFKRSQSMLGQAERREATQPGNKYVDFSVPQPDGKVVKLSDYAGNGKYTLVDYWASWCGPCIRQTRVLKEIQEKYKDDPRLQILGVAVWDKVEDTERAIEQHKLTWPCIVDAQTIPTDIYGIMGIPSIMLIGPDGTILSRDKQGDELKADVDAALAK